MSRTELTQFELRKLQMEYAVPLIRDLQRLLGEAVVNEALARRLEPDPVRAAPGSKADFSIMGDGVAHFAAGKALTYDVIASDGERFDMNVNACAYARMMTELDAQDIGHLLLCDNDYAAAERIGMSLERSQTIMQGFDHCDFRYRRRSD
ncbi:MAG: L-2-amino-thiazoline-4-carboxylic acid hydrolase [Pseudomonadota bacterium]